MALGSSPALVVMAAAAAVVVVVVDAAAVPAWRNPAVLKRSEKLTMCTSSGEWEWCDDVLGCLQLNNSWYPGLTIRPLNAKPASRASIGTTFMLHTREYPAIKENVVISADRASIEATTFDATKPTKIVLHGFIDTGMLSWLRDMAEALLIHGDYNVIRVDWGGGSLPLYCNACANIRVVGLEIAHLVNFLVAEFGLNPADVHLIGHSLGSHASGYAGERIPGLGRITGMDPAGPYFGNTPEFIHLDPTDAKFVDAIHTDADGLILGYGTFQTMGHLDFYPNSGQDQPGCDPVNIGIDVIDDIGDGMRELVACSHGRAYQYFTDSAKQSCPFLAHECTDYASFEIGRCASCGQDSSRCAFLGIRADEYTRKDRTGVKMYLDTDQDPPYCYYHYQVIVDTAHPKNAEDWVQGHLDISLYGDNGQVIENMRLTKEHERFDHGQPKYFMFKSHVDLSRVIRILAKWRYDDSLTNIGSYCWMLLCNRALYLRSVKITSMDYYPESNLQDHSRVLCLPGSDYVEIKSSHTMYLDWDESCAFAASKNIERLIDE